ncbi:ABC transporter permease [Chitinispirillales bacterium ANBcel5]|uniref:ABC transporter permease n=1 Tax=Cellulosispirillum alkaliphilum TaxID=3039283 RepID=UPI002A57E81A|nr:ABC transporter permease [Chitinispirillales bacterium ANBcel5]
METQDITLTGLIIIYALAAIPLVLFHFTGIKLVKKSIISIARMSVQLFLVGVYLQVVFTMNNFLLNALWILIMIIIAGFNVNSNAGVKSKPMLLITFCGLLTSTIIIASVFIALGIQPQPLYDARYLIPIAGMIVGNSLRGNVIGLDRFVTQIKHNEKEYLSSLFMGATPFEAVQPFFINSVKSALLPTISTVATMGIVSLPGMMTGQILGGSSPLIAIRYQVGIMLAIFASSTIGIYMNLFLSFRYMFNQSGFVKSEFLT